MTDRSFSALSQRAFDLQKPGSGTTEWTSKIQAMKEQVEGAEEDDHKRLEEEIAAARQARLRRSLGNSAGSRVQTPTLPEQSSRVNSGDNALDSDGPTSDRDRQSNQDTALQKLMGRNNVHNPDKLQASMKASDRVSLASFIGGSATGPKLNKHAPQPNAHDPTQFIQPDTSAPHPIFGRGGVAMPGLAKKKSVGSLAQNNQSDYTDRYHSSPATSPPTTSVGPIASSISNDSARNSADVKRRSFNATPKSPSPALAARYAEKFEQSPKSSTPVRSQTLQPSQAAPILSQRKSFSSFPSSASKLDDITASKPPPSFVDDSKSPLSPPGNSAFSAMPRDPVVSSHDTPRIATTFAPRPAMTESRSFSALSQTASTTKPLDFGKKPTSVPASSDKRAFTSYTSPSFVSKTSDSAKETPLKRLMDANKVYNPDTKQQQQKALEQVPVSLAAYIGGSAKGPRLNKHAPQPDAHDPTQFIQPNLAAPHPIFGRGGVAMPGMATKTIPALQEEPAESTRPSSVKSRWPPVTAPPGSRGDTRPVSPQKTGGRERTTSTPSVPHFSNVMQASIPSYASRVKSSRSVSPSKDRERTLSTPSYVSSRTFSSNPPASQPVEPAYLARPIIPDPTKISTFTPQIPPATVPSPAFQKSPPPKDPTPSISRLKGRGFVQNMVKASVQLETIPASTAPPSMNKPRPLSAGKAVLDRWQPSSVTSSAKSPMSPDNITNTLVDYAATSTMPSSTKPLSYSTPLSSTSNADSEFGISRQITTSAEPFQRSKTPGVGSGTTMVLIKPSKSNSDLRQASLVDELGVQSYTPRKDNNPLNMQSSPKKPLIHKEDRAGDMPILGRGTGESPIDSTLDVFLSSGTSKEREGHSDYQKDSPADHDLPKFNAPERTTHSPVSKDEPKSRPTSAVQFAERDISHEASSAPASPGVTKHTRIPSTGNRATVMDLAIAMANVPDTPTEIAHPEPLPTPTLRQNASPSQSEKRRSTYEKYSAIMLPPLKEEATPVPSPVATLGRSQPPPVFDHLAAVELLTEASEHSRIEETPRFDEPEPPAMPEARDPLDGQMIYLAGEDEPLTTVDISKLRHLEPRTAVPAESQTISVDVFSIIANTAQPIARNFHIFYDTEIICVVNRSKSKESGLVSTTIWCWLGRQCQFRDREDKKLRELATRYGTSPIMVHQLAEPVELVKVLGGQLITRQGTRAHWSAENTTMHLVRSHHGVILIDEHDFGIKNLCSAFSYCFTILGTVYVWYGAGSVATEREAALAHARTLDEHATPIEMVEGTSDEDEIFWMMLGDDDFAQADYWKWKKTSSAWEPKTWRVDGDSSSQPVTPVAHISLEQELAQSVYIIDCVWELFVVVGKDARGNRRSIRLALDVAMKISQKVSQQCPFPPTVHVLILPSKLPLDLQLNVRDLDEAWLNNGDIPDHMNVVSCAEALQQLARREWSRASLKDPDMLPLGVGVSDLP